MTCFCQLPLLKELNLKLVKGPPSPPSPTPVPPASTPHPSPGVSTALANNPPAGSNTGSGSAPSGLTALAEEYEPDNNFHWDRDKDGFVYDAPPAFSHKSNISVAFYPTCNHAATAHIGSSASSISLPVPVASSLASSISLPVSLAPSLACINLSRRLQAIIARMSRNSISPGSCCCFSVADTGGTNYMFPDKMAFILYKAISNLQVWMANNSYLPVLGCGTAIISLNGQGILVRHALHVPGLAVLFYSLCTHLKQHGCCFLGSYKTEMLVCFPWFVLSADTLSDCHLSYKPLGWATPLDTLHYVQPCCPPSLYPSKQPPSSCAVSQNLALIEDDSSAYESTTDVSSLAEMQPSPTMVLLA
jgi:hypothetical protein